MPVQRDIKEIEAILNEVLNTRCPPVGRCRLLSSGFGTAHALNIAENITGHKECLGCGNCVDICPFLSREPGRRDKTEQRTSMALESIVGEDCDLCDACVLVCPTRALDAGPMDELGNKKVEEASIRFLKVSTPDSSK